MLQKAPWDEKLKCIFCPEEWAVQTEESMKAGRQPGTVISREGQGSTGAHKYVLLLFWNGKDMSL